MRSSVNQVERFSVFKSERWPQEIYSTMIRKISEAFEKKPKNFAWLNFLLTLVQKFSQDLIGTLNRLCYSHQIETEDLKIFFLRCLTQQTSKQTLEFIPLMKIFSFVLFPHERKLQ